MRKPIIFVACFEALILFLLIISACGSTTTQANSEDVIETVYETSTLLQGYKIIRDCETNCEYIIVFLIMMAFALHHDYLRRIND